MGRGGTPARCTLPPPPAGPACLQGIQMSMSLKSEPSSEPLHIYVLRWLHGSRRYARQMHSATTSLVLLTWEGWRWGQGYTATWKTPMARGRSTKSSRR